MRTRALTLGLTAVLAAGVIAGCGDDDSNDSAGSTTDNAAAQTASVPEGNLSASTAPPKVGIYGGIECGSNVEACKAAGTQVNEVGLSKCMEDGVFRPSAKKGDIVIGGREYNVVCFRLTDKDEVVDYWLAGKKIIDRIDNDTDRFKSTCQAGWCASGEWFSTRSVDGQVRNPTNVSSFYTARFVQ